MILLITSAFFWLLSLLLSSLVWLAVYPLRKHLAFTLVFSVIFQVHTFLVYFYSLVFFLVDPLLVFSVLYLLATITDKKRLFI